MNNIEQLTAEQLIDPTVFSKFQQETAAIVWHLETKTAFNYQDHLEKLLKISDLASADRELFDGYQKLLIELKLVALPMLDNQEVIGLIREHFLDGLRADIEMGNRIAAKLFSLPLFPRDDFRQKLQEAILTNEQKIGHQTIREWLTDYNDTFDYKERSNITYLEYMTQNRIVHGLPDKERNWLRELLRIYDDLLLVTLVDTEPTLEGLIKAIVGTEAAGAIATAPTPEPTPSATPALSKPIEPEESEIKAETAPPTPLEPAESAVKPEKSAPASRPPRSEEGQKRPPVPPPAKKEDIYQEKIEEGEKEIPRPPVPSRPPRPASPDKTVPRLEGNIVDLKNNKK